MTESTEQDRLAEWKKTHLVCDNDKCRFSADTIFMNVGDKCTHCNDGKLTPFAEILRLKLWEI